MKPIHKLKIYVQNWFVFIIYIMSMRLSSSLKADTSQALQYEYEEREKRNIVDSKRKKIKKRGKEEKKKRGTLRRRS